MLSILNSIKKLLGIEPDYHYFDPEIIIYINGVFSILLQLGVGPEGGFWIKGEEETWDEFLSGERDIESVKTYVYLKVRLAFDPPQTSYLIDAIKNQASELEWRLLVQVENNKNKEVS